MEKDNLVGRGMWFLNIYGRRLASSKENRHALAMCSGDKWCDSDLARTGHIGTTFRYEL